MYYFSLKKKDLIGKCQYCYPVWQRRQSPHEVCVLEIDSGGALRHDLGLISPGEISSV